MGLDHTNPVATPADRPQGRPTRRRVLSVALGAAAFGVYGARPTRARQSTPAADAPLTVQTIHGPVVVPASPVRVLAVNFPSALALLELGITPVGVPSYLPALPPGYPDASGIPVVDDAAGELDLEKIASLMPDLIVGSDWADPELQLAPYDLLSGIAPTALFEWKTAAGNWEAEAAGCADAIGKTAELDALRTMYEQKAAGIATTYAEVVASLRWDLISASDQNWYLYGPTSSHGKVVLDAGIQLNAAANQSEGYAEYSFERFDLLHDTGVLLVRSAGDDGVATLATQATFTTLPAVVADHVFTSDYFFPSSYGLSVALLGDIERAAQALSS